MKWSNFLDLRFAIALAHEYDHGGCGTAEESDDYPLTLANSAQ